MACALRLGQRELAAIALYRRRADFSERDRLCLDVLRPHLAHLQRNAEAMARTRRHFSLLTRGVEAWHQAFVIVGRDGRISARGATSPAVADPLLRPCLPAGLSPRAPSGVDAVAWHDGPAQ